jgi:hypothetical protein
LRSPARRAARRLVGLLATAVLLAAAFASARLVVPEVDGRGPAGPEAAAANTGAAGTGRVRTLRRAVAVLRRHGAVPVRRSDWRPRAVLRVLVGRPRRAPDGPRRAFFFARGRLVGHDARGGSAHLRVAAAGRRAVVLVYRVHGGERAVRVRFRWTQGRVAPLDRIPPLAARRG